MSAQPIPISNSPIPILNIPEDPSQNIPTATISFAEKIPIMNSRPTLSTAPQITNKFLKPISSPTETRRSNPSTSEDRSNQLSRKAVHTGARYDTRINPAPTEFPKRKETKKMAQIDGLSNSTKTGLIVGTISSFAILILIILIIKYKSRARESKKIQRDEFGENLFDKNNFIPRTLYTENNQPGCSRKLNTTINSSNAFQSSANPFESQKFMFGPTRLGTEISRCSNENESHYIDSLARLNTLKNANLNSISSYDSGTTGIQVYDTNTSDSTPIGGNIRNLDNLYVNSNSSAITPIDSLYCDSIYQDSVQQSYYSLEDSSQYSDTSSIELEDNTYQHSIYHDSPYSAF